MRTKNIILSLVLLLLFSLIFIPNLRKTFLIVFLIVSAVCILIKLSTTIKHRKIKTERLEQIQSTPEIKQTNYLLKNSLITQTEKPYFETIKKIVEPQYIIQTQINLASIIDKKSPDKFRNELFRNIDFGIFDQNYKPLLLIEINDESHMTNSRRERDQKVQSICKDAGIPIVTLWTKYGVNETYINKRLCEHLSFATDDFKAKANTSNECEENNDTITEETKHERNDTT